MALINTTNVLDTTIASKVKVPKNMVRENYYIENLQHKRDLDWDYRYNVVGIEQELGRQNNYTNASPIYTPLDVVIRSVKGDRGEELGTDWAELSFRDLKHPDKVGDRYRFDLSFPDMSLMTEEEKHYQTCIWLAVNKSPINPGDAIVVRRCNGSIGLIGSKNGTYTTSNLEVRYEPAIIENELKYMNFYYNLDLVVPQAEYYITMQLNYFTNFIKINNRIIIGGANINDVENNSVYKVKAVIKTGGTKTFYSENYNGVGDIPLIVIALDKDVSSKQDNFGTRIPSNAPVYLIPGNFPEEQAIPSINNNEIIPSLLGVDNTSIYSDITTMLVQGTTSKYELIVKRGDTVITPDNVVIDCTSSYFPAGATLTDYYVFTTTRSTFSLENKKMYKRGNITVNCSYNVDGAQENVSFKFKLGGFY